MSSGGLSSDMMSGWSVRCSTPSEISMRSFGCQTSLVYQIVRCDGTVYLKEPTVRGWTRDVSGGGTRRDVCIGRGDEWMNKIEKMVSSRLK